MTPALAVAKETTVYIALPFLSVYLVKEPPIHAPVLRHAKPTVCLPKPINFLGLSLGIKGHAVLSQSVLNRSLELILSLSD